MGWKLTNEPNIIETVDTVWERLFDLHLNYPYKCYWECTTTHGRNAVSIAEKYNLLEYLIVLSQKYFLNIPQANWNNMDLNERFISRYDSSLPEDIHKKLTAFFKPYNEKFFNLINKNDNWG